MISCLSDFSIEYLQIFADFLTIEDVSKSDFLTRSELDFIPFCESTWKCDTISRIFVHNRYGVYLIFMFDSDGCESICLHQSLESIYIWKK